MERKVDVMIIGAQKSGTTSLLRYLGEHPNCIAHPQKEFAYFVDNDEYGRGFEKAYFKYYSNQIIAPDVKIVCKNAGIYVDEEALLRLKENNPKCKLIFILRNPIERTYSSYLMEKNYGSVEFEFSDLPELIKRHEENDNSWGFNFFIDFGHYAHYLKKIYRHFPKEQVKVLLYRDLRDNALGTCKELYNFIGIDPDFEPNVSVKHNVTQKTRSQTYAKLSKKLLANDTIFKKILKLFIKENSIYKYGEFVRDINKTNDKHEIMNNDVRDFLINYYKPHNEELEKLIGKDLSDWNK